jgi:hypothetical protein
VALIALGLTGFIWLRNAADARHVQLSRMAMGHAQVARNLSRGQGEGFRSDVYMPIKIGLSDGDRDLTPKGGGVGWSRDLTRPPIYPALLAGAFRVLSPSDRVVRLVAALGVLFCALAAGLLAARIAGPRAGLVSAALVVLNVAMLQGAAEGEPAAWVGGFVALGATAIFWSAPRTRGAAEPAGEVGALPQLSSRRVYLGAAAVGAGCGLAYLTEYTMLYVIIAFAAILFVRSEPQRRGPAVLVALGAFLIVVLPWWVRNAALTGWPLFSLDRYAAFIESDAYPGSAVFRSAGDPGSPYAYVAENPKVALKNLSLLGAHVQMYAADLFGLVVLVGALVGMLTPLGGAGGRPLRYAIAGCFGVLVLGIGATMHVVPANYMPLLPLLAALAGVVFVRLWDELRGARRWVAAGAIVVILLISSVSASYGLPSHYAESTVENTSAGLQWLRDDAESVGSYLVNGTGMAPGRVPAEWQDPIVITDDPQLIAWKTGATCVWLPYDADDLETVVDAFGDRAPLLLYLTPGLPQMGYNEVPSGYAFLYDPSAGPAPSPDEQGAWAGLMEIMHPLRGASGYAFGAGRVYLIAPAPPDGRGQM